MQQIAKRRDRAITSLHSQGKATEKGAGGDKLEEKDGASRGHLTNRKNTYCVVERCDGTEVLMLARAAAATKKKRNAWLTARLRQLFEPVPNLFKVFNNRFGQSAPFCLMCNLLQ